MGTTCTPSNVCPTAVTMTAWVVSDLQAARIMIEDAMCLLLDVDDIDRLLASKQAHGEERGLQQRRTLLLQGLVQSLLLPHDPQLPKAAARGEDHGTAMKKLRIVILGFGTARQRMVAIE
jgi:DNA topoisomerase 2-associated protein PAT1